MVFVNCAKGTVKRCLGFKSQDVLGCAVLGRIRFTKFPLLDSKDLASPTKLQLMYTIVQFLSILLLVIHTSSGCPINSTTTVDLNRVIFVRNDPITATEANRSLTLIKEKEALTSNCFPAIGFKKSQQPPSSLQGWWCDGNTEYAFVGFSYEVSECEYLTFHCRSRMPSR